MSCKIAMFVRVTAILCWVAAGVDASPWGFELDPDASLFVVAAACVLSYAWIARAHSQPAVELYLAGKDIGRREALLAQRSQNVERLDERRLRIVDGA